MAKKWSEVESSEAFKGLSKTEKEAAKEQYFTDVVSNKDAFKNLSGDEQAAARNEFLGKKSVKQPEMLPVDKANIFNEFVKANKQVSSGVRNTFLRGDFKAGFDNPEKVDKFSDSYPQAVMNVLEKSKFLREHPNAEQALFQTFGAPAKLAGIAADSITNPAEVAVGVASNIGLKALAPKIYEAEQAFGRFASKYNPIKPLDKIARAPEVFKERIGQLSTRTAANVSSVEAEAAKEVGANKALADYTAQGIKSSGSGKAAAAEKVLSDKLADYDKQFSNLDIKAQELEKKFPLIARESGNTAKKDIISAISRKSQEYGQRLNKILGGKEADIAIDGQRLQTVIADTLAENNVLFDIANGEAVARGPISPAEQKLINLYNRSTLNGGQPVTLRSLIKDKQLLGRSIKYGKQFNADDSILDDAYKNIGNLISDTAPEYKALNAEFSPYFDLKKRAIKTFDPFGDRFSPKGRQFVEKIASGNIGPEEADLVKEIEGLTGKPIGTKAIDVQRGIDKYRKFQNDLVKFKEVAKTDKDAAISLIKSDVDKQLGLLEQQIKIEESRIGNKTLDQINRLKASGAKGVEKLETKLDEVTKKYNLVKNIKRVIATGLTMDAGYNIYKYLNR